MYTFPDTTSAVWRKSSYSQMANDCVEITDHFLPAAVPVRDSKAPVGPVLAFPVPSWEAFVMGVKSLARSAG
ncbi:DUF397 domain-containing protein [Streptomyces orinoci]|uniref:DUF397 domain-containing protein n=1 Tax=Streptomyces orinoci TaxID=67339 RepID=A0ABV3JZI3_STRON|nr:DUF397 domain-containing protein [Streptomyces orinoci]